MRVYIDNNLVSFLASHDDGHVRNDLVGVTDACVMILGHNEVEVLLSEESLAEIRAMNEASRKRASLERCYRRLKDGKSVIRNSTVGFDDPIATFDSPDVFWSHPYDDTDLDAVRAFLVLVDNTNDMDARYIANAMLPENAIDVFLTFDLKTIWLHRSEIQERFGVTVQRPEELVETLSGL